MDVGFCRVTICLRQGITTQKGQLQGLLPVVTVYNFPRARSKVRQSLFG